VLRGPFQWALATSAALLAATMLALAWRCSRATKTALAAGILLVRSAAALALDDGDPLTPRMPTAAGARVEQLDVGQGDAALVRLDLTTGRSAGLIDAGPPHALSPADWIGILVDRGLTRLDWTALTHLDEDHAGGLRAIADWIPIGCAATASGQLGNERGESWQAWLGLRGVALRPWDGGCAPLEVLPPDPRDHRLQNGAMSTVFLPLRGGGFYLNAGDGDAADERRAIPWFRAVAGRTTPGPRVLKISHHGSRFSSDPAFLRAVAPTEAWISVGLSNTYGHPTYSVLERLRELGIPVRRTDLGGVIRLEQQPAAVDDQRIARDPRGLFGK
jgi:competence protein ComEC